MANIPTTPEQAARRLKNLQRLVAEIPDAQLQTGLGITPHYLYAILKGKAMGSDAARTIERATDKPNNWLDEPTKCKDIT